MLDPEGCLFALVRLLVDPVVQALAVAAAVSITRMDLLGTTHRAISMA